jgi:hypothetical protein
LGDRRQFVAQKRRRILPDDVIQVDESRIGMGIPKWRGPESNRRHHDFQSCGVASESGCFAGIFGDKNRRLRPTIGAVVNDRSLDEFASQRPRRRARVLVGPYEAEAAGLSARGLLIPADELERDARYWGPGSPCTAGPVKAPTRPADPVGVPDN